MTSGGQRTRRWAVLGAVVLLAAAIAIVLVLRARERPALPRAQADGFLAAWSRGDVVALQRLIVTRPAELQTVATSLTASSPGSRLRIRRTELARDGRNRATARYHAHIELAGFGPFDWDGSFQLVHAHNAWTVQWSPANLYPGLRDGEHLVLHRTWQPRGAILGRDGAALIGRRPAVTIGVEPGGITNLADVQQALASTLGVDPAEVANAIHAPGVRPFYFVPIITVTRERFGPVDHILRPVNGIHFRQAEQVLPASDGLAIHVLGRVGEITAEQLQRLGAPYRAGDTVGRSGLEEVDERRLAGKPEGTVDVVANGRVVRTIKRYPGTAPQPVQTTLDLRTQQAAESALAGVTQPAALVATDAPTGEIRAVVSTPTDQAFDRALDGRYPPGSTFKVVTTAALLRAGRTASTPAPCPPTLTVDGKPFTNFEGEAAGALTLAGAFTISCNTAFLGLAEPLPPSALVSAAQSFGFNSALELPLPVVGGAFPTPASRVDKVAAAIGQGRVTASPLQMATVAAAVDAGVWRSPVLVRDTPPPQRTTLPVDPTVVSTLRSFMRQVVADPRGTAHGAGLPGLVSGKTGTAEFGSDVPPKTHAWFIGYRGDLAFAVLVEGGGVGGRVAAPVAARFLTALGG
jgi:cell division protein FtsI/penicillin-binding protein 2